MNIVEFLVDEGTVGESGSESQHAPEHRSICCLSLAEMLRCGRWSLEGLPSDELP